MRVPAGRPHFNQSPNPRGTQEFKLLIENLFITPQVKLTSVEANCKSGCNFYLRCRAKITRRVIFLAASRPGFTGSRPAGPNSKDKSTNGIMEYSIFKCTVLEEPFIVVLHLIIIFLMKMYLQRASPKPFVIDGHLYSARSPTPKNCSCHWRSASGNISSHQ